MWVFIRFLKVVLMVFWLVSLSHFSVFAGSMDEILLNSIGNNDLEMVKTAVTNGADVNYNKKDHYSPLGFAVVQKNPVIAAYLLEHGADVNGYVDKMTYFDTPLGIAIANNDLKMIGLLVGWGADVNGPRAIKPEWNSPLPGLGGGGGGLTPLIVAIEKEFGQGPAPAVVQFLIMNKADVNQATVKGYTPLMAAAHMRPYGPEVNAKFCMIAKELLKAGADPAYQDDKGKTALQYAIDANFPEMIKILLPVSPQ